MTNEELVKNQPGSLVEKIVTEVITKESVEIHFEDEDDDLWSAVRVHDYDDDTEMSLRLHPDNKWLLQFGYYDKKDDFIELVQPLTQKEIDLIPKAIQKVMQKVLSSEEGLRVPGVLLSK